MTRLDELLDLPGAFAPSFAGDGTMFFLCDADGSAQVWRLPAGGGTARAVTAHADAVAFVEGSPVDGRAVFGRDGAGDERQQLFVIEPGGGVRALTADPATMFGWGGWSPDGQWVGCTANDRNPAHADPCVIEVATGARRRLTELEGPHAVAAWHPDGGSVVVSAAPRAFESTLLSVDVATGFSLPMTAHLGDWRHDDPRWRADGGALWMLSDRDRAFLAVLRLEPTGGLTTVYAPEGDVERMEPSPDGSVLAVVVNEGGWSRLRLIDAASGAVVAAPEHPPGTIATLSWRPDGSALAFDLTRPIAPSAIWMAEDGTARAVFSPGGQPAGTVDYAMVAYPTFDGRMIPAFLAEPAGARPALGWPVVVWVHGGPEAQARPAWRPDLQAVLAMGIAVLVPNVRGSTGYGRAYAALDDRERRPDAVRDVAAARDWVRTRAGLDGARVGVWGQSYGGWMVLSAVTEFPDRWACGVDLYGIARWKTFFEATGPWRVAHREAEYGDPVADAELLERLSPLHKVDRITCPMLVAQGLTDPRVPPGESAQIVAALRARDVPVEYLTFPDEGHGFLKRVNRRVAFRAITAFLGRHLLA